MPSLSGKVSITVIGNYDFVTKAIRHPLEPQQQFVEATGSSVLRKKKLRISIVLVKNVLDSHQLRGESHQEDIVRWVAPLNHMESMPQEDPPRIQALPEQGAAVLPEVARRSVSFSRHRMPVNMYSIELLVPLTVALASRAEHSHFVSVRVERASFVKHPRVGRDRLIFNNNQNSAFHEELRLQRCADGLLSKSANSSRCYQQMLSY